MKIKILGICGSPIKNGNTQAFLNVALKAAAEMGDDVETEMVALAGKEIKDCLHCLYCTERQEEGKPPCIIKDDMVEIWPKLFEADGLLLATPVYSGRLSGYLANFLDRFRSIGHGIVYHGIMVNKPAGTLAVLWNRDAGGETSITSILWGVLTWGMIPACGFGSAKFGAVGLSSPGGMGEVGPEYGDDKLLVLKDERGCRSARMIGKRVVVLSRVMKAAGLIKKKVKIPTYGGK